MSDHDHDHDHDDHGGGHDEGHHGGHGHGSPWIQHHYDDGKHQFDSGKLGIWFFLVQEILFFAGLFVAYILYRHHHPEIYAYAHYYLDVKWGAINTAVLIISSLTAAWSVRAAQLNQRKVLIGCLAMTIACACGFLCIKYIEYSHKIHEKILFGRYFDPCVASGGNHLLNKHNTCPGVKTSVVWDWKAQKAARGCLDGATGYDLNPEEPGIQGKCEVKELKMAGAGANRKAASTRPIEMCEGGGHGGGHGGGGGEHGGGEHGKAEGGHGGGHKYPCWTLESNYHVCPKGPAAMVHYGDGEEHENIEVEVTCESAPAAVEPKDPLADVEHETGVGEATFKKPIKRTKHDEQHEWSNGPPPEHTNMFFSIYFAMTGLHGIHVLLGIFVYIWLLIRAIKGHFTPDYFGPVDYAALYWHLVDLIWIFLFPLLYLIH
jgi:cytochrome c oxidase subunit III